MSAVLEGICVCALYFAIWFCQECTLWDFSQNGDSAPPPAEEPCKSCDLENSDKPED
ncbi:MAG: hypothetical protein J6P03_01580 [Opitutales bacterium]|nr:hypothetical protein [Opitutales bacterium]